MINSDATVSRTSLSVVTLRFFRTGCKQKGEIRFPRSNFSLISGRRVRLIRQLEEAKPELFLRSTPSLHSLLSSRSLDLVACANKCSRWSEQQESFFTVPRDLFDREKAHRWLSDSPSNCAPLIERSHSLVCPKQSTISNLREQPKLRITRNTKIWWG